MGANNLILWGQNKIYIGYIVKKEKNVGGAGARTELYVDTPRDAMYGYEMVRSLCLI